VEGTENLAPDRPYIFAANHQSQFDILALQGFLGIDFRWLAKKELFTVPIWGTAMRRAGYIPIDRSHGRQAIKSLDRAAKKIAKGTSVIIFPEGTRSKDGKLQKFKSGAMRLAIKSGVPLVPVAITGTYKILPKGRLLVRSGQVTIQAGQPIDTQGYKSKDKSELAALLQEAVAGLMKPPDIP
jgi:1-acyl-sn-glycerol-3-phosphate acyltransferase